MSPAAAALTDERQAALMRAAPVVFVLIWSTGFIVARFGMPHAPPMGFLAWRYALSVIAFLVWVRLSAAPWPVGRRQWLHLAVTGIFVHAGYLGGVWAAVKGGMSAGATALIVGLQPLLTALWLSGAGSAQGASSALSARATSPATSHATARATSRQWAGLVLGLAGVVLVVWHKLGLGEAPLPTVLLAVLALLSMTAGTLYQKRFVQAVDVRTASVVQMLAALVVTLPLALLETEALRWQPQLWAAMAWSVLALSLGGSSLLFMLVQRGAATRVTSLLYLVPPCTAVLAWVLFDEALGVSVLAGMALTALGVWLVVRAPVVAPGA